MPIPAIILAAGNSVRLGQPKQLLRPDTFGGEAFIERTIRFAVEAEAFPIFVVLGAHAEAIEQAANLSQATVLHNGDWAEGIAGSLRYGVHAVIAQTPQAAGALLMVCDQPALSAEHLRLLLVAHRANAETIASSCYAGHCGVPAVVPRSMFPLLLNLTGDRGARIIFQQQKHPIQAIEFPDGEWDIDTMEDLERLENV